ncbi:hypothetical protein KC346_g22805, partial [Hortaea werneckii]
MANTNDFTRFSKKVVQYFWDPLPKNDDPAEIWCLGRQYDSRYLDARQTKVTSSSATSASPSAQSDSTELSQADSAVVTEANQKPEETAENGKCDSTETKPPPDLSRSDEEALGWPAEFLDD